MAYATAVSENFEEQNKILFPTKMKTIEEKLSAIKAINDEKDRLEQAIQSIHERQADEKAEWTVFKIKVPSEVIKKSDELFLNYFTNRKAQLIAQAEQLMK